MLPPRTTRAARCDRPALNKVRNPGEIQERHPEEPLAIKGGSRSGGGGLVPGLVEVLGRGGIGCMHDGLGGRAKSQML